MHTCPDCHTLLDDHARFCDNCGLPLAPQQDEVVLTSEAGNVASPQEKTSYSTPSRSPLDASPGTCSACGYANVPGEMFCQNCGVQLAPVASSPPPPPTPVARSSPALQGESGVPQPAPSAAGVCSHCGSYNDPQERFCLNCGLQLQDVGGFVNPPPYPIAGEHISPAQFQAEIAQHTAPYSEQAAPVAEPGGFAGRLVLRKSQDPIVLPANKHELLIGRADPVRDIYPDIDLAAYGGDASGVSRLHARLAIQNAQIFIEDLNSTNFTFLNMQRLQPGQRYELKHGDEVRLGVLVMHYLAD